jgi:hypothetical protein
VSSHARWEYLTAIYARYRLLWQRKATRTMKSTARCPQPTCGTIVGAPANPFRCVRTCLESSKSAQKISSQNIVLSLAVLPSSEL